jgi:hypothetical protein
VRPPVSAVKLHAMSDLHVGFAAIPRFSRWRGTRRTEDWHARLPRAGGGVGPLHIRSTRWRDGVRFEEVSLGYPRQWRGGSAAEGYLREILPGPV